MSSDLEKNSNYSHNDSDADNSITTALTVCKVSNPPIIKVFNQYEAHLPIEIRNKIYDQLELIHRFKLINTNKDIASIFNPYNTKLYSIDTNPFDLALFLYCCELRNSRASHILTYDLSSLISDTYRKHKLNARNNPDRDATEYYEMLVVYSLIYSNDKYLLTLHHINGFLEHISKEYALQNTKIVDTRLLTIFMRGVLQRLSKIPRDLFYDYIMIYEKIYIITVTLITINYQSIKSTCDSFIHILNDYFDDDIIESFIGNSMFDIIDDAFNVEIVPHYDIEELDEDLCPDLIIEMIESRMLELK
jgi:hypothetical protein